MKHERSDSSKVLMNEVWMAGGGADAEKEDQSGATVDSGSVADRREARVGDSAPSSAVCDIRRGENELGEARDDLLPSAAAASNLYA